MPSLPTLPRKSWLQRISFALAGIVSLLSIAALGDLFASLFSASTSIDTPAWKTTAAVAFAIFGLALLLVEAGHRRLAWLAALPAALGLVTLLTEWLGLDTGFEIWLAHALASGVAVHTSSMPAIVALALLAAGGVIPWLALRRNEPTPILAFALTGSLLGACGSATLLGYALSLPAAYRWGAATGLPANLATIMIVLGLALLLLAWRGHAQREPGQIAPAWIPLPVVVISTTLTLIVWAGLRERELFYLGTNAQLAINNFASTTSLELERQTSALERLGRRWGGAGVAAAVRESDAITWLADAPGAQSLAWISPDLQTLWYYPDQGNGALIGFNQGSQPARSDALALAARQNAPVISNSLPLAGIGQGFVIYAPVYENNAIVGYAGAEFLYRRFFETIDQRLKISLNHHCTIYIGQERVYDSTRDAAPAGEITTLESVFNLHDRRVRIVMSPSSEYLHRNRRHLPELALAAGIGITLLLGLSVHLARTAFTGLRSVQVSNTRLQAENDERKRIEAMLKISDERLRLALDATSIGIFEWNLETNRVYYSADLRSMLGLPAGGFADTPEAWQSLIHAADLPAYLTAVNAQLSGKEVFIEPEYRVRTPTGDWRWLYARSKIVGYTPLGAPGRVVGTIQDVTARKAAARALRHSQATARKLSLVASKTDNLVIIVTPQGNIEWVNESFERIMEYSLPEIIGQRPTDFMAGPETRPRTLQRIKVAISRGEGLFTDIVNYSKSGRKYHLHLEIQPVRNEHGALENFIAILADITVRVETENALRRAKAEADATSRTKSDFLASMSHEIRTPMNGVIGMTSLLLETPLTPEQRDCVTTLRSSGEALLTIINDILDFSKIESGKLELEHQPFDLVSCIEETLDLFAGQASARRLELAYAIATGVPSTLVGDVTRLRQVLANLVNNAVKFTPSGRVSVETRLIAAPDPRLLRPGHRLLEISVSDTGIGIPADRLDRLFQPFSQVDSSTTRKYGGTGLGLVICQRLCALMGGEIHVQSEIGRGSTFTYTLQFESASAGFETTYPTLPIALHRTPLLCVDDNPVVLRRMEAFFRNAGLKILTATTTDASLALLRQSTTPPLLLADLELISPTSQLAQEIAARRLPVVGLVAAGSQMAEIKPLSPLFAAVAKPLRTLALIRALNTLFRTEPAAAATSPLAETRVLSQEIPLNILLVEDNPVNQKVALRFLERLGYRADAVANGLEAIQILGTRNYELVFMDLQMPEMDGFEATRQIRRMAGGRQPRIIALTANALQSDRDHCASVGMDDFITKPIKLHEISDVIRRQFPQNSLPV